MHTEPITIPMPEGAIGAQLYLPAAAQALVLLHPATAVTQDFYAHFARYLTTLGLAVLTYDYRGTGRSRGASLRGSTLRMSDWIDQDVPAVTLWARARFAALPLLALGHSVGGHALVLQSPAAGVTAGVLIASHAGITRTIRGAGERARVWLVMRVLAPLLCALYGYMPGRRIGLGEDLPRGVMHQWRHWSTLARYFYDDPALDATRRAAALRMPLLVLGFDDDPWANPRAMDILLSGLTQAPLERRQMAPRALGLDAIGHMGFFRKRNGVALWPQVGQWLLAQASNAQAQCVSR